MMTEYLYLSPRKIKQYYFEVTGKQIPDQLKKSTGTQGSGELSAAVASAEVKREYQTERTFSTFWPKYLGELLASKEMRKAIKVIPESLKNISPGSWCRCLCLFRVAEFDKKTNQVNVIGEVPAEGHPRIRIGLSCSYSHFASDETDGEVSSYAMPFVHDKISLKLESVFLVLTAEVINGIYHIVGSPIYMALPKRRLPWQK
jgi:hypothetical protein